MRKLIITLILISSFLIAHAQRKDIDSLRKLLAGSKQDTNQVLLLSHLGFAYERVSPDSAIFLSQQALQLSKDLHFLKGEQRAQTALGSAFTGIGNYPKALTVYLDALKSAEAMHDVLRITKALTNIANIYSYEGDERQSIIFMLRSLVLARSTKDSKSIAIPLLNLGDSYEKLNKLDSALYYTLQGYQYAKKLQNPTWIDVCLNNLGNIYRKMNRPDSALHYYRQAIILYRQTEDNDAWAETTIGMAKVFKSLKLDDSSLYYARQSMTIGQRGGFTARVLDASQFLTEYFKDAGRLDSAFIYQQVLLAAKDSLISQEKTKEVQDLTFSERQRQIDIQEREASYRANLRFYLLVALVIFLVSWLLCSGGITIKI